MDWTTEPHAPPPAPGRMHRTRRMIATAALAIGLLVLGGSAVAWAADPSASPDPAATAQPADDGTTAPSTDDSTAPSTDGSADPSARPDRASGKDCPAKDGSAGGDAGSGTTPDASAAPDATTTPDSSASSDDA